MGGERMRTYEFHSELPPERVIARLRVLEGKPDWLTEHHTSVQFLPDGRFYLLRTMGFGSVRPFYGFCGRVEPDGSGSRITGRFQPPKRRRAVMGGFFAIAWIASILLILFGMDPSVTRAGKLALSLVWFPALALWTGLGFGLDWLIGTCGFQEHKAETLRVIETTLLRE